MGNSNLLLHDAKHRISSPFGYRIHPITGKPQGHNGVDYSTYGQYPPIYAPFNGGEILRIGVDKYGALFVYIGFKKLGYVGLCYHCSKIVCYVGQKLNKNDIIGYVGNTGRSTGSHLHFSWMVYDYLWNNYYKAHYVDFEKYRGENVTVHEAKQIVKTKANLDDDTIKYLADMYKYGDILIVKLAEAMK